MSPEAENSTIHNYFHSFVDRKEEVLLIKKRDDSMQQALTQSTLPTSPEIRSKGFRRSKTKRV